MAPRANNTPLVVIVGETASGKTALAIELAQQFNGEIIAADSRTVYKGMDIGTAKPSPEERQLVPHHLIDVVDPDETFTAADFQRLANGAIVDIASRGKIPFLVGGTGLYIDAVIYNFTFRSPGDPAERARLGVLNVEQLQGILEQRDIPLPANEKNPRHLIRAIETNGALPKTPALRPHTLLLGVRRDIGELREKITQRVESMLAAGLEHEVRNLISQYGWEASPLQTIGYQEFRGHFTGELSLDETKAAIIHATLQYAKRQRTWFKRNKSIHWISKQAESVDLVTTFLNK